MRVTIFDRDEPMALLDVARRLAPRHASLAFRCPFLSFSFFSFVKSRDRITIDIALRLGPTATPLHCPHFVANCVDIVRVVTCPVFDVQRSQLLHQQVRIEVDKALQVVEIPFVGTLSAAAVRPVEKRVDG